MRHTVTEAQERGSGLTVHQGFHHARLHQAGIAGAAFGYRLARPAVLVLVGNRAGADNAARAKPAGFGGVGDQGGENEKSCPARPARARTACR